MNESFTPYFTIIYTYIRTTIREVRMALSLSRASNFSQQGTVDWVALSNQTVFASVAVFARLAAAKVDMHTFAIAHTLCDSFQLPLKGSSCRLSAVCRDW